VRIRFGNIRYVLCNLVKLKKKTVLRVFALIHNYQLFMSSVSNRKSYVCT